jgi:hypothetical protein
MVASAFLPFASLSFRTSAAATEVSWRTGAWQCNQFWGLEGIIQLLHWIVSDSGRRLASQGRPITYDPGMPYPYAAEEKNNQLQPHKARSLLIQKDIGPTRSKSPVPIVRLHCAG